MEQNHTVWIPEFSLRNSALPSLASEVAIDINNYIQSRSREDESVKHLSILLNDMTLGENPRAKLPDNCIVLSYAISGREKFEEYWKGKNTDEVVKQINLIAKDLKDFKSLARERQVSLTDFCVNLSKETAYHYTEYF